MQKKDLFFNEDTLYISNQKFLRLSLFCRLTGFARIMPDFFIGGVQKGGTTSLYADLAKHPQIIPAKFKEIFYYGNSENYKKGSIFYQQFFGLTISKKLRELKTGKTCLTLDASTDTFESLEAPKRILKDNPKAKIIFILRNPVNRAFSHYKMSKKNDWDLTDFEKALELEEARIEEGKMQAPEYSGHNYAFQRLGYKSRGIYVRYLKNWIDNFPKENILVISSEDFFKSYDTTFRAVCDFLGIDNSVKISPEKLNESASGKMNHETRKMLMDFYKPHNEELFKLIGKRFDWD